MLPDKMKDEQIIKDAAQLYADLWNAHDAHRFNELFTETADFCTFQGIYLQGLPEIQKAHQFIFDGPFHNTFLTHKKTFLSIKSDDLAVYRSEWKLVFKDDREEDRSGMFIFVMQKIDNEWKLVAGQNTDIAKEQIYHETK